MSENKGYDFNEEENNVIAPRKSSKEFTTIELQPTKSVAAISKTDKGDKCNKEFSLEEALNLTGNGKFGIYVVLTAGLVLYAVNSELYNIGYVIPAAECDLEMDLFEKSVLVTVQSVGCLGSQFFWGIYSDKIGRKNVMFWTLLLSCLTTIASVLTPWFWLLTFFRLLNGIFVAAPNALIFVYVGEFFGDEYRSIYVMVTSTFIGMAFTLFPTLALLIMPLEIDINILGLQFSSWRLYMLLVGLVSLPACLFLHLLPETPKFLAQADKNSEALQVLGKIYKSNYPKEKEFPVYKLSQQNSLEEKQQENKASQIFSLKYLKNTMLVCILQIGIFATSSGVYLWYPDIIQRVSKTSLEVTVCQALNVPFNSTSTAINCLDGHNNIDSSVYTKNIFVGLGYVLGYIAISFVVKYLGIKKILLIFLGTSGVATFVLHWISNKWLIDMLFVGTLVLCGLCVAVVNAAVVEIYPTNLRGLAVCIGMVSGRLGSIISSSVVGYLLEWNCDVTFFIYAASLIGCSILSLFLRLTTLESTLKT